MAAVRAVTSTVAARTVRLTDDLLVQRRCACGHPAEVHEHYRTGSDCSLCGQLGCARYRYRPFTTWRS